MRNKAIISIVGFILFFFGFMSFILSMVGVEFAFLLWIDRWGAIAGLAIRFVMIVAGLAMLVLSRGTEHQYEDYMDRI